MEFVETNLRDAQNRDSPVSARASLRSVQSLFLG